MVDSVQCHFQCLPAHTLGGLSTDAFHSSCNKWGLNRYKMPRDFTKLPCTIENRQHFGSPLQVFRIKMKNCRDKKKKNINTLRWGQLLHHYTQKTLTLVMSESGTWSINPKKWHRLPRVSPFLGNCTIWNLYFTLLFKVTYTLHTNTHVYTYIGWWW